MSIIVNVYLFLCTVFFHWFSDAYLMLVLLLSSVRLLMKHCWDFTGLIRWLVELSFKGYRGLWCNAFSPVVSLAFYSYSFPFKVNGCLGVFVFTSLCRNDVTF